MHLNLQLQMLGLSVWNKATLHYELKDGIVNRATGTTRLVSYLNLRTSLNGGVISRCVCVCLCACVCGGVCVSVCMCVNVCTIMCVCLCLHVCVCYYI